MNVSITGHRETDLLLIGCRKMFTYQIRPRRFVVEGEPSVSFPADAEIVFHFEPKQPFGAEASGGRVCVAGSRMKIGFNANSGKVTLESDPPLGPLQVLIESERGQALLEGNKLTIRHAFGTHNEFEQTITAVYYLLPTLLNVGFDDPTFVDHVAGTIGGTPFRWELRGQRVPITAITQDSQERAVIQALNRLDVLAEPQRRRLVAALHYFHVACRLDRQGVMPGEFLAEVILNLAKTLEVLFPSGGGIGKRDAVRNGLLSVGYTADEVECDFIPAIAIRNEIGVAHGDLSFFTMDQLEVIHDYAERVEPTFRELLDRVIERMESGAFVPARYDEAKPRDEAIKVIEKLRSNNATRLADAMAKKNERENASNSADLTAKEPLLP